MNSNIALTEYVGLLASLDPASQGVGVVRTPSVNTLNPGRVTFVVNAGVLQAGATIDFAVEAAATSGGTYAVVAGLAACPQITVSGNKVFFEVRAETLQSLGVGPWIRGKLTIGTAAAIVGVEVLGSHPRFLPMSDYNIAAVQAVVQN